MDPTKERGVGMNKHTKGPWVSTNYGYEKYSVNGVSGVEICSAWHAGNARLISAAPELLEALTEIVAAADGDGWKQLGATFEAARAAIAKAKGEQPK